MEKSKEHRAVDAQQLLDNPLFNEAFDTVEDVLVEGLRCGIKDKEAEARTVLAIEVLSRVKGMIVSYVNDGKISAFNERKKKSFIDRVKTL